MKTHVHPATSERDAFHLQPEPLIDSMIAAQLDMSSSADNSLPGKINSSVQRPHNLACSAGIAGRFGNRAVRRHVATRYSADRGDDLLSHSSSLTMVAVIVA